MTERIDFQLPENRWAAQMACDESNAVKGYTYWTVAMVDPCNPSIYALALRILRTEKAPVDPVAEAFDEVMGHAAGLYVPKLIKALKERGFEITALKERGA